MNLIPLYKTGEIEFIPPADNSWSIAATGDYGLLPYIQNTVDKFGIEYIAKNIRNIIQADISIANLEIALCDKNELNGAGVRGDRKLFAEIHRLAPFSIYSLANNHIMDAGANDLLKTFDWLENENIPYIGAGRNKSNAANPLFIEQNGVTVGFTAFAQNENQIAGDSTPGAAELIDDDVIAAAEHLVKNSDVSIVVLHDGFEFMDFPRLEFKKLCRKLVSEIGVKIVIAHHPHVPQGIEKIGDNLIFYSLGNFLFNQPHFYKYEWTRISFVPVISFNGSDIAGIELRPLVIDPETLTLHPAGSREKQKLLERLQYCSEIISDDEKLLKELNKFYTDILMPEFFGWIRDHGNDNNGDFSEMIEDFKGRITVHNLLKGFLDLYSK